MIRRQPVETNRLATSERDDELELSHRERRPEGMMHALPNPLLHPAQAKKYEFDDAIIRSGNHHISLFRIS
jgi:hypothetical protein